MQASGAHRSDAPYRAARLISSSDAGFSKADVVRTAYLGEKLGDTSALENPASLDEIKRAAAR